MASNIGLQYTFGAPAGTTPPPSNNRTIYLKNVSDDTLAAAVYGVLRGVADDFNKQSQSVATTAHLPGWQPIAICAPFWDPA